MKALNLLGGKLYNLTTLKNNKTLEKHIPLFFGLNSSHYNDFINDTKKSFLLCEEVYCWLKKNKIKKYSIRSSPVVSMPGQMETILNCGDLENDAENIKQIHTICKQVYNSINNSTCKLYAKIKKINILPPAVIVQAMVDGTKNKNSGTIVVYTHNLSNCNKHINGSFATKTSGDMLVSNMAESKPFELLDNNVKNKVIEICNEIYKTKKVPQEIEITYEDNIPYILQTRDISFHGLNYIRLQAIKLENSIISAETYTNNIKKYIKEQEIQVVKTKNKPIVSGLCASGGYYKGKIGLKILKKETLYNSDLKLLKYYEAVITKNGSIGAHPSTICRNLNIPYIIAGDEYNKLKDGQQCVVCTEGIFNVKDVTVTKLNYKNYEQFI